jgi:hypothetical protein
MNPRQFDASLVVHEKGRTQKKRAGDGSQRGAQGGGETLDVDADVASTVYRRPTLRALGWIGIPIHRRVHGGFTAGARPAHGRIRG